jgi:hypothetical protein
MGKRLTAKRLREVLSYDHESGLFHWRIRASHRIRAGSVAGCGHRQGYVSIRIDGKDHFAARLAVLWMTGKHPTGRVGYLNGDRSDCRWENIKKPPRPSRPRRRTSPGLQAEVRP